MKKYIDPTKYKDFDKKSKSIQNLINETLYILEQFGIPVDGTPRRLEKMAIVFLACGNIKTLNDFKTIVDSNIRTREIIDFVNKHFNEQIKSGSYDDIRRKDLLLLIEAGVVLHSSPNSATNDSTRGYNINPLYADLLKQYKLPKWESLVRKALSNKKSLSEQLQRRRNLLKVEVTLAENIKLQFSAGKHNDLQKVVIEEFLPRYGFGAEVLYVGDTKSKYLHLEKERLEELKFFELAHNELPDIIAYSTEKNWLYLIEAVHSSGPISEVRLLQLRRLTMQCTAEIVYVTAFLDKRTFRKWMADIAWETEVWIADNPDHLVHFNGDKFLGPYKDG